MNRNLVESIGYLAVVLAAVLACGKDGDSDKKSGDDANPAKIGETVSFEDSEWKVTKVEDKGQSIKCLGEDKKTDGRFIMVSYSVKNLGKTEESILDTPKVKDSDGREFKQWDDTIMCLPEGKESIVFKQLPPSMNKDFVGIYELPKDAKDLKFMARELAIGASEKPVKLDL